MFAWTEQLASLATQWLEQGNPLVFGALFLIAMVIELGVPVPFVQDTVLLFVGFNPDINRLLVVPSVMVTLMLGRISGASIVYWVIFWLNVRFVHWLGKRSPKLLTRAQGLGAKLGNRTPLAVALARLTPGLLTPSSIAAGLFRVNYVYFCIGIIIASVITDGAEIAIGVAIRTGFTIAGVTPSPTLFIGVLLGFTVLVWLITWLWNRFKTKKR